MSKNGFIDRYLDNCNRFYEIAMNQFDFYLKLLGTDCIITRVKDESKYKSVYGAMYTSDLVNDEDLVKFKYRILINMNQMRRIWSQSSDQFEIYDNKSIIKLGDVISFKRRNKLYRFKVIGTECFSEAADVIYKYTLSGAQEIIENR